MPMPEEEEDRIIKKALMMARDPALHRQRMADLLTRIKAHLPAIDAWLEDARDEWGIENAVYRFYHQSSKVFGYQSDIEAGDNIIRSIGGESDPPTYWYRQIVAAGTGREFSDATNQNWFEETHAIPAALLHVYHLVQLLARYGREYERVPEKPIPVGWATVLELFELR